MEKEFHITYSCDLHTEGAKMGMSQVKRLMISKEAEFVSSTDDYDGFIDSIYHFYGTPAQATKTVNEVLGHFKNSHAHISVTLNEHQPKVLLDISQVNEKDSFNKFVGELSEKYNGKVANTHNEAGTVTVSFFKTKDRQNFQNEYCQQASVYMKNQQEGVNISPDWEDTTLIQTNTTSFQNKKGNKFGY